MRQHERAVGTGTGVVGASRGAWGRRGALVCLLAALTPACVTDRAVRERRGSISEQADDAVGHVTVSSPIFTPIERETGGNRRLDFGPLRDELALAKEIKTPSFSSERKEYSMLALALAAKIAGTKLHVEDLKENEYTRKPATDPAKDPEEAATAHRKKTRRETFDSPEVPDSAKLPEVPPEVMAQLVDLLKSAPPELKLTLPPDELATLIAANKTYMVNLEQVFNVEGYDYVRGFDQKYVPYRMHFTATAEPGWYSRWNQYDAVAEVELTVPEGCTLLDTCHGGCSHPPFIILNVSPAETAQTISEFSAALSEFKAAVSASGSYQSVAFQADAQKVNAIAERLIGLRAEKSMTVAFPGTNRMRIRFQSTGRGDVDHARDLQPTTRMLTATVLVRRDVRTSEGLGVAPQLDSATEAARQAAERAAHGLLVAGRREKEWKSRNQRVMVELGVRSGALGSASLDGEEKAALGTLEDTLRGVRARAGASGVGLDDDTVERLRALTVPLVRIDEKLARERKSSSEEAAPLLTDLMEGLRREAFWSDQVGKRKATYAANLKSALSVGTTSAARSKPGLPCRLAVRAYFSPSVWDERGRWSPPRETPFGMSRPVDRLRADSSDVRGWIPAWLGGLRDDMKILWTRGYYRIPLAELEGLRATIGEAQVSLSKIRRRVSEEGTELERAAVKEKAAAVEARVAATAAAKKAVLAAKPDEKEAKEKDLAAAQAAEVAARKALATAEGELAEAREAIGSVHPDVQAAQEKVAEAEARLRRKREELLRKGKVVIRYRCDSPSWTLCADSRLVHTLAFMRVTGLSARGLDQDDAMDDYESVPTEMVIETGPYEGVIELEDVDLSFAVPVELRGVDDLNRLQPLRVVLRGILRSGLCEEATAEDGDGRVRTAGVERTCVRDVYLYPQVPNWEDTPDSAVGR